MMINRWPSQIQPTPQITIYCSSTRLAWRLDCWGPVVMVAGGDWSATSVHSMIRCLIILAQVICADETPVRVGPGSEDLQALSAGGLYQPADRKQPPHGGQQPAAPGGATAGVVPGLGEYGECR
jgi:hypothetical protein